MIRRLVLVAAVLSVAGCAKVRVKSYSTAQIVRMEKWGTDTGYPEILELEWTSGERQFKQVEASCDLIDGEWKNIYSWSGTFPGDMQIFSTEALDCDSVFYRVSYPPE